MMKAMPGLAGCICASREQVLAPLLLSPPSPVQSKQVAKAYLCSQTDLYRILIESIRAGKGEKLLGMLQRGWEALENIVSLLNERGRLKNNGSDPEELNKTNRKILDSLSSNGQDSSIRQSIDDSFARLLEPESGQKKTPTIYFDATEPPANYNLNIIEDYRLTLDAQLIKLNQQKYSNKNSSNAKSQEFSKRKENPDNFTSPMEMKVRLTSSQFLPDESFSQPNGFRYESPELSSRSNGIANKTNQFSKRGIVPIITTSPRTKHHDLNQVSVQSLVPHNVVASAICPSNFPSHTPHFPTNGQPQLQVSKSNLFPVPATAQPPLAPTGQYTSRTQAKQSIAPILLLPASTQTPSLPAPKPLPSFEACRLAYLLDHLATRSMTAFFHRTKALYKKTLISLENDLLQERQKNERLMMLLGGLKRDGWECKGWIDSRKNLFDRIETEGSKYTLTNSSISGSFVPNCSLQQRSPPNLFKTGNAPHITLGSSQILEDADECKILFEDSYRDLTHESTLKDFEKAARDTTNRTLDRRLDPKCSIKNFADLGGLAQMNSGNKFSFRNIDERIKKTSTLDIRPRNLFPQRDNPKTTIMHYKNLAKSLGFSKLQTGQKENSAPFHQESKLNTATKHREVLKDKHSLSRSKSKNKQSSHRIVLQHNGAQEHCGSTSELLTFN